MSLSKNVPQEAVEEVRDVISFEDLEFEAEYVDEEQQETAKYFTISGKESQYNSSWEKYKASDFDVGQILEGVPEINIFENEDKTYNAMRLRLIDEGEIVDLYFNFPKKDFPYVTGINKGFDFYRTCFDFIYSVLKYQGESNVVDSNGEEINRFKKVNLENFAKYVDSKQRVSVKLTEGNPDSEYNSWIIYEME